jgi:hypothetical protein
MMHSSSVGVVLRFGIANQPSIRGRYHDLDERNSLKTSTGKRRRDGYISLIYFEQFQPR